MDLKATLHQALSRHPEVRLAFLFGSQARGTARPDSDVDLAVDAPGLDRLSLAAELGELLEAEVQVIDLRRATYALLKRLLAEGIAVYHVPGALGQWYSHTLADLETDGPGFERMNEAFLQRLAERHHG